MQCHANTPGTDAEVAQCCAISVIVILAAVMQSSLASPRLTASGRGRPASGRDFGGYAVEGIVRPYKWPRWETVDGDMPKGLHPESPQFVDHFI